MVDRLRFAVIDGHPIFRNGLIATITDKRWTLIAQGDSADDAFCIVQEYRPDVLIIDTDIVGGGLSTAEKILAGGNTTKIVLLAAFENEADAAAALRLGIHAYVSKRADGAELLAALDSVRRGEPYMTPSLASRMLMQAWGQLEAKTMRFSDQDKLVLSYLAKGYNNSQMAAEFGVNLRTVKHYMTRLSKKMGVHGRVKLLLEAQRLGLILRQREMPSDV